MRAPTSRRSPRRLIRASPANPDEASSPVQAAAPAMVSPNRTLVQVGEVPRSIGSTTLEALNTNARPSTITVTWSTMSIAARLTSRLSRSAVSPITLAAATAAMIAIATTASTPPRPSGAQGRMPTPWNAAAGTTSRSIPRSSSEYSTWVLTIGASRRSGRRSAHAVPSCQPE